MIGFGFVVLAVWGKKWYLSVFCNPLVLQNILKNTEIVASCNPIKITLKNTRWGEAYSSRDAISISITNNASFPTAFNTDVVADTALGLVIFLAYL